MTLFHVRQYRPNYFTGFENIVVRDVPEDQILQVKFLRDWEARDAEDCIGFKEWLIEPYPSGELLISATYANGQRWVAAFAVDAAHPMAKDWRYVENDGQGDQGRQAGDDHLPGPQPRKPEAPEG